MREETLVTCHPASKFGSRQIYDDDVIIMHRIITMVNKQRGGGYATRHSDLRYIAGVFDKIVSRHGSSFKTLADAVARARQQYEDDASAEERGG